MSSFRNVAVGALVMALLGSGCGDGEKTPAPGTPASQASSSGPPTFKFSTGPFEIGQGDIFECFYTDTVTEKQMNVRLAKGKQGNGGHHITVYYADQKKPVGHHPCQDVEMLGLRQVAGAGDGKEGIIGLPEGYATKIPAGKQLVVQAHYIRTEPGTVTVEDTIELETVADEDVKAFANAFVVIDAKFKLPARQSMASTTDCVVPKDVDLLLLLGHMHEWGKHYKLDHVDDDGKLITNLYETDWDPLYSSHPPVTRYEPSKPLKLKKGMRLRQTCQWDNSEEAEMAFPREMCIGFGYYIPDDGFIECFTEAVKK